MMIAIENYPKKDRDRNIYVRYPVMVTEAYNEISLLQIPLGKWVAVDVLKDGYKPLLSPNPFDTFDQCQKACDRDNKFWGFKKDEIDFVVSTSMHNSTT